MTGLARIAVAAVAIAALVGGWLWWNAPERQIRRTLAALAEALSHDAPSTGLASVASAASLAGYVAEEVVVEPGRPFPPLTGREAVFAAAARLRAAVPVMRLELVDMRVTVDPTATGASVECTATATITDRAGRRTIDAREVSMRMTLREGRWVVERARAVDVLEPVS